MYACIFTCMYVCMQQGGDIQYYALLLEATHAPEESLLHGMPGFSNFKGRRVVNRNCKRADWNMHSTGHCGGKSLLHSYRASRDPNMSGPDRLFASVLFR